MNFGKANDAAATSMGVCKREAKPDKGYMCLNVSHPDARVDVRERP